MNLTTDAAIERVVRPGWFLTGEIEVMERDTTLDEPLRAAAAAMRARPEAAESTRCCSMASRALQ